MNWSARLRNSPSLISLSLIHIYINDFFKPIKDEYLKKGSLNPLVLSTDTNALNYQIPGGMLSNLVAQLTAQNKMDKFNDVLLETPKVRKDLGYPCLLYTSRCV